MRKSRQKFRWNRQTIYQIHIGELILHIMTATSIPLVSSQLTNYYRYSFSARHPAFMFNISLGNAKNMKQSS